MFQVEHWRSYIPRTQVPYKLGLLVTILTADVINLPCCHILVTKRTDSPPKGNVPDTLTDSAFSRDLWDVRHQRLPIPWCIHVAGEAKAGGPQDCRKWDLRDCPYGISASHSLITGTYLEQGMSLSSTFSAVKCHSHPNIPVNCSYLICKKYCFHAPNTSFFSTQERRKHPFILVFANVPATARGKDEEPKESVKKNHLLRWNLKIAIQRKAETYCAPWVVSFHTDLLKRNLLSHICSWWHLSARKFNCW